MENKLKICLISFDNWSYDKEIIKALSKKNIIATHINIGAFKHKNTYERISNTFSKIVLNTNPKVKKRQDFIINTLKSIGKQDQILVLNPDLIESECHLEIKKHTSRYIAYLYDSVARSINPIEHLLHNVFDDIYSFDNFDVEKYGFKKITNYNYLELENTTFSKKQFKIMTIASFDKRFPLLNEIANQVTELGFEFQFICISKNISYKLLKYRLNCFKNKQKSNINSKIQFQSTKIPLHQLKKYYDNTEIILDLVQGNQTGLSFRVFEAMALQKKLITDNKAIRNYPFYNPNNILILDSKEIILNSDFFKTKYEPLTKEIYNEFTIANWITQLFNL